MVEQRGSVVSATNAAWDGTIQAGGSVAFGLYGVWAHSDTVPTVLTCQTG